MFQLLLGVLSAGTSVAVRCVKWAYVTFPMQFWSRNWHGNRSNAWWIAALTPSVFLLLFSGTQLIGSFLPAIKLFWPLILPANYISYLIRRALIASIDIGFGNSMLWAIVVGTPFTALSLTFSCAPLYLFFIAYKDYMQNPGSGFFGRGPKLFASFGSAHFGTPKEHKAGMKEGLGRSDTRLLMGRSLGFGRRMYSLTGHVLTCAPTGAGKGIGCALPNLLHYRGSVFCLDVKGEMYMGTAKARAAMGQTVSLFDPFSSVSEVTAGRRVAVNWLSMLDTSKEDCISLAATLADAIVTKSPKGDQHWDESASSLLQGLMLCAAHTSVAAHIGQVRAWLTEPEAKFTARLEEMAKDEEAAFGVPARAANTMLAKVDRERSSVMSTVLRHTAFLDDPRVVRALGADDSLPQVSFARLKTGLETFYLVMPPDKMATYHRLARVTVSLALEAMVTTPSRQEQTDTLFLLDEFAQLGYFAPVENGLTILRGYHVTLWCLVQDFGQLSAIYPKWRSFLANSHLQVFGTQDLETAKYVSDLLGTTTVRVPTVSHNKGAAWSGKADSTSYGHNETSRPLKTADEVRLLGPEKVVLFERGKVPFLLRRLDVRAGDGGLPTAPSWLSGKGAGGAANDDREKKADPRSAA